MFIISGVTGILCSSRLFLEVTAGKVIHESSSNELSEKISANNYDLSGAAENTTEPLDSGGVADLRILLAIENIISNAPKVTRNNSLGSYAVPCFISLDKIDSIKNLSATIPCLPEHGLKNRRFILLVRIKDVISMNQLKTIQIHEIWSNIFEKQYQKVPSSKISYHGTPLKRPQKPF